MQGPIDYSLNVIDPISAGLAGFNRGRDRLAGEQAYRGEEQRQGFAATQADYAAQVQQQQNLLFEQGQQDRQMELDQLTQDRAKAEKFQADLGGLAARVKDGTATAADFTALTLEHPEFADELKGSFDSYSEDQRKGALYDMSRIGVAIKAGRTDLAKTMLEDRLEAQRATGMTEEAGMTEFALSLLETSPEAALATIGLGMQAMGASDEMAKVFGAGSEDPAAVKTLKWRASEAGLVPGTPEYQDFIATGGDTGADKPAAFRTLELQAEAAGLTPGTAEYQDFMATKGAGLVSEASASGKAMAEGKALLSSMESKLPELESVVADLEALSDQATYTKAGVALDEARKQMNLEPRPAAIARAEYIAMVDNQVLPLLRDTFGAAFTQKEGDTLRATLGDPDKSPAEKKAVLRAFIAQKKRDIQSKAKELKPEASGSGSPPPADQADPVFDKWGAP